MIQSSINKTKPDFFCAVLKSEFKTDVVMELQFCDGRKFRFDYAMPEYKIAIEIDGGTFKTRTYRSKKTGKLVTTTGGRHNSAKGFLNDMEKLNLAASLGWTVLRFTPQQKQKSQTYETIWNTLKQKIKQ